MNGMNGMNGVIGIDDEGKKAGNEVAMHDKRLVRRFMQKRMDKKDGLEYREASCDDAIRREALIHESLQEKKPSDIPVVALSGIPSRTVRGEVQ